MLLHGSNKFIEGELTPHISFHYKPYVYATSDLFYAIIRAGKFDINRPLLKEDYDGEVCTLVELQSGAFEEVFDTEGYVYDVDDNSFIHTNECMQNEYISTNSCEIIGVIVINNVLETIKSFSTRYKLIRYEDSDEYWKTVRGGKDGYMKRRLERIKRITECNNTT